MTLPYQRLPPPPPAFRFSQVLYRYLQTADLGALVGAAAAGDQQTVVLRHRPVMDLGNPPQSALEKC
jgi:hypothetical protein